MIQVTQKRTKARRNFFLTPCACEQYRVKFLRTDPEILSIKLILVDLDITPTVTKIMTLNWYIWMDLLDLIFKGSNFNKKVFATCKINDQNSTELEIYGNEILVNVHSIMQSVSVYQICFLEG